MDALLSQLLSFPPHPEPTKPISDSEYDKHIKNLVHHINTIPASKLTSGVPGGGDLLDVRIDSARMSMPAASTDIVLVHRLLIRQKIRSHTSTHCSLTFLALLANRSQVQYQTRSRRDQHYGKKCWTSWNASMCVRLGTRASSFGGS